MKNSFTWLKKKKENRKYSFYKFTFMTLINKKQISKKKRKKKSNQILRKKGWLKKKKKKEKYGNRKGQK